jgi:hypothetical protein
VSDLDLFEQLVNYVSTPEGEAEIAALLKQQKKIEKMRRALAKEIESFNERMAR